MAEIKKTKDQETNGFMEFTRKVGLAYIGAFGVMGDEAGKLFERFVERGEVAQQAARKRMKQNGKDVRQFAQQVQKQEKHAVAKANKSVKKAVKRVEHALA